MTEAKESGMTQTDMYALVSIYVSNGSVLFTYCILSIKLKKPLQELSNTLLRVEHSLEYTGKLQANLWFYFSNLMIQQEAASHLVTFGDC